MITVSQQTDKKSRKVRLFYYDPLSQNQCTVTVGTLGKDITRARVQDYIDRANRRILGGWNPFHDDNRHPVPGWDQLLERYLDFCAESYRPATVRLYRSHLRNFIRSLGKTPIFELTKVDVQRFVEDPSIMEGSKQGRLSAVRVFLDWAEANDVITGNVARKYGKLRGFNSKQRAAQESQKRAVTIAEIKEICDRMVSRRAGHGYQVYADAFLFACATGLRRSTVGGLLNSDFKEVGDRLFMRFQVSG